ncbi:MAG: bifunctional metallophosphatase/5'-nucleotidase [Eubacterium sp.]|nr:bifunctional metallophosphatase/5'-nucleotidase [Eubacterium sp.]
MKKRILALVAAFCVLFSATPAMAQASGGTINGKSDDIVILYENDVHCAVDGYAKIKAMKTDLAETHDYVGIVSVGDFIQGSSLGAISQGKYIVDIMNLVGYDAVTLGNHEFDYKLQRLNELVTLMSTKPVCSNFQKIGATDTVFKPYAMVSYGDVDIAYIGITTPSTISSSSPIQFLDENGDYVYTFNGDKLYEVVQNSINAAKAEGAEYIVALSHLGTEDVNMAWSAQALVENTEGLDVVLDGHSHSVVESLMVEDKSGKQVGITSTGTQFANIGKLTIGTDGTITTELIPTENYTKTDAEVTALIAKINEEYSVLGERKIGYSEVNLTTVDADGNRIIRNEETNLGDFCADAFRVVTGADIGFINGGGIRANMDAGDVTFNDILSVFPFNNLVCVAEVTGQDIVDMLELGVMSAPEENGSFQHVSGITFNLDTSFDSTVKLDQNEAFVSVDGKRRVSNVKVLNQQTGDYEPIDLTKTYKLASHSYLLMEQGSGATMFKDAKILVNDGMLDVEMLEFYIAEHLDGVIGEEYAASQGRITLGAATTDNNQAFDNTTDTNGDAGNESGTESVVPSSPQTGDDTMNPMWILLIGSCCACVCIPYAAKRNRMIK